jgi:transposase-like protein
MKRYTDDQRRIILDELAASGKSRAAFCRDRGLCYKRVSGWVKAHREVATTAEFVEVEVPRHFTEMNVEVWLPGAVCVLRASTPTGRLADFCRKVSKC